MLTNILLRNCPKDPVVCGQASGMPTNGQNTINPIIGGMRIDAHKQKNQPQPVNSEPPQIEAHYSTNIKRTN
jgi:hypothetical protein